MGLCALLLTSCAITRPKDNPECAESASFEKGASDAATGKAKEFYFPRVCPEDIHADLLQAYRDGYEAERTKHPVLEARTLASTRVADGYAMPIAKSTWVCEVEASEKVFTGMGASKAEAAEAAHTTCSSHFQASYCGKTECKQSL